MPTFKRKHQDGFLVACDLTLNLTWEFAVSEYDFYLMEAEEFQSIKDGNWAVYCIY